MKETVSAAGIFERLLRLSGANAGANANANANAGANAYNDYSMQSILTQRIMIQLAIILIIIGTILYGKVCQMKKKMSRPEAVPGFPSRPHPHWLVGHLMVLRGAERGGANFVRGYQRVYCEYADPERRMGSLWFFHFPCVFFLYGKDAKKILCSSSYRKPAWIINSHTRQFLGADTLLALNGREWRSYRSAVHKSFTSEVVKASRPFIYQIGNTLADTLLAKISQTTESTSKHIEDDITSEDDVSEDETLPSSSPLPTLTEATSTTGPIIDILPLMKMATIDVFGLIALRSNGVDFGCSRSLELSPLAAAFDHLTTEYTNRLKRPWDPLSFLYSLPTKANRDYHRKRNMIRGFISDQIAQARTRIAKTTAAATCSTSGQHHDSERGQQCDDMLTNLIRATDSENTKTQDETKVSKKTRDEALGDILMTLLFAGHDTTSIALTYALYLLAKNPSKKAKCLEEIDAVFGENGYCDEQHNNNNKTKGQTLPPGPEELPYTKGVILETLRLFPPAPSTTRTIEKPVKINATKSGNKTKLLTLAEGQMVMIPIWIIQRSEFNYPRPNEMIPERWVRKKRLRNSCNGASTTETLCGKSNSSMWEVRPEDDSSSSSSSSVESTQDCDMTDSSCCCCDSDDDDDTSIPPANRDAFCSFAAGARNCVGKNLAVEESVILLACLVHKLCFELVSETYEVSPCLRSVVQQPDDDLPMIVRPRR